MDYDEEAAVNYQPDATPLYVEQAQHKIEQRLQHRDGIVGFGITMTPGGTDAVVVYVENREALATLPRSVDGVPVIGEVTGEIRAQGD
ncbi:MAG TPA: hypothetical protein DDY14_00165 [Chromatiaceae bacterium]|jgi:hypothetical protein|nr:MAG: hypothetical protein N838_14705 [Thiohalocapsa sp. PB-PSB1]QQO56731.1 MAG: hypothetical protein N838_28570 [Thiohalocapsa sp. PB-PSB1]HBG93749.1 hypothetical protein [Chromatiaceae bacterium]HCS89133.1 hypothetical protein [Chromatiaceae bacterium]